MNYDSTTHVLVEKNGIQDTLPIAVWEGIGGTNNTDGWLLIPTTPPEVLEVIKKKSEAKEVVEDPTGEVADEVIAPTPTRKKAAK